MHRFVRTALAVLLSTLGTALFAGGLWASSDQTRQHQLITDNNAFGVHLYRQLSGAEGNLLFSPYSISSALGMTLAGARGNTAREMHTALHFQLEQAALHPAFHQLNGQLMTAARETGQRLNIANALVLAGGEVNPSFQALVTNSYDAEIFSGGVDRINSWVSHKTGGKIPTILNQLDTNAACVLLNAIAFQGTWAQPFPKNRTQEAPFFLTANTQTQVQLMHRKGSFQLLTEPDFQALSLPYQGKALSMILLLPNAGDGLAAVENQCTAERLQEWLARLDRQPAREVAVALPRFRIETRYDLIAPLRQLGLEEAFAPGSADFSAMGGKKGDRWISQIVHKAFAEVNEEGTEAAAATAVMMVDVALVISRSPEFRADHPFLWLIRDNQTGVVLFMGRITDPGHK